ncbi:proton-transporting V-type ATPase complex assembly regulator TMEM9-like [Liolophura sinensis]|uniref:proton-transporting V-type ATPase complex assembly regulator TMEM9-like n=1 Tax=Liolophura sinensis TaxID=3198878 RepID=UPI003158296B
MTLSGLMLWVLTLATFFVFTIQAQYGDTRCKCVCPAQNDGNSTARLKKVFVKDLPANECKCDMVVSPLPVDTPGFCLSCECNYEYRNTTTIKVVVIFIICVVSLLFVYMLFMLGLDPFLVQRRNKYHEQMNEEDDQTVTQVPIEPRHPDRLPRQRSIIHRVTDEQKKWKGVVQAQRQSVYDSHSMLN